MRITQSNPFKWRHFPGEVILLCVRWYLRYPLAYEGPGANSEGAQFKPIRSLDSRCIHIYTASAACQISGIVA